jgi:drug/metabolite transporter (DMT)-like permease
VGFGGFLILIAQVHSDLVFLPLVVTRSVMLATALLLMLARRLPFPGLTSNPVALLAGVLDAGGNVFFLFARQYTRLDVAAVLSSFYPVATVVLSRLVLHERVTRTQWIGAGVCLAAVGLITM